MNKQMGNKRKQAAEWIYQYRFALAFNTARRKPIFLNMPTLYL